MMPSVAMRRRGAPVAMSQVEQEADARGEHGLVVGREGDGDRRALAVRLEELAIAATIEREQRVRRFATASEPPAVVRELDVPAREVAVRDLADHAAADVPYGDVAFDRQRRDPAPVR